MAKTMKKNSDKRKDERFKCYVPVEGKDGSCFEKTQTVDISKNGIGFISSNSISLKEKIAVELVLSPEGDPVLVVGQVKWVRPVPGTTNFRVGMTFEDVLNGSSSRIKKYFKKTE